MSYIALPVTGATFIGALALTAKSVQKEGLDPLGRKFEPYVGAKNAKVLQTGTYATLTLLSLAILSSQTKIATGKPVHEGQNEAQAGNPARAKPTSYFSSINFTSIQNQVMEYAEAGANQVSGFITKVVDLAESAGIPFIETMRANPFTSVFGLTGLAISVNLLIKRALAAYKATSTQKELTPLAPEAQTSRLTTGASSFLEGGTSTHRNGQGVEASMQNRIKEVENQVNELLRSSTIDLFSKTPKTAHTDQTKRYSRYLDIYSRRINEDALRQSARYEILQMANNDLLLAIRYGVLVPYEVRKALDAVGLLSL